MRAEVGEIVNQLCFWCRVAGIKPKVTAGAVHLRYKCAALWRVRIVYVVTFLSQQESHSRAYSQVGT